MKDLFEKLSPYNIFNYLLPGTVFVILADSLTRFHFIQKDIIIGFFLYYFIGLIISRFGSILIEPLLKWIGFIKFASYSDYVSASTEDKLIEVLSEANNMYRTFCSLFASLILLKIYESLTFKFPILERQATEILVIGMLVLFCFSYRKQTQYITKRIQSIKERPTNT